MTVCTNDVTFEISSITLCQLRSRTLADAEDLVPSVVELEHERVALAAVEARMRPKVLPQE
jgi:hypothetical protein